MSKLSTQPQPQPQPTVVTAQIGTIGGRENIKPDANLDVATFKEMAEYVDRRGSAVAVIPGKGMVMMTKNKEGNYELLIGGTDGQRADYTINPQGQLLKVGETSVANLTPYHEQTINLLNEYLSALPPDQIKLITIPIISQVPDFKPDEALLRELQDDGYVSKTRFITSVWAATGGTPDQLKAVVEESKHLSPYALTPKLMDEVQAELRKQAVMVKADPEAQVRDNRRILEPVYKLANLALSEKLTQMYQTATGDKSSNVVVSSGFQNGAFEIGDGNVIFSEKFYDSIIKNFPNPADQEKIILDILKHERAHYSNSDLSADLIIAKAKSGYFEKLNQDLENGTITKDQAVAKIYAANLLTIAAQREQERRADGVNGLDPITEKAIEKYFKEIAPDALIPDHVGGGLFLTHPPTHERAGRQGAVKK